MERNRHQIFWTIVFNFYYYLQRLIESINLDWTGWQNKEIQLTLPRVDFVTQKTRLPIEAITDLSSFSVSLSLSLSAYMSLSSHSFLSDDLFIIGLSPGAYNSNCMARCVSFSLLSQGYPSGHSSESCLHVTKWYVTQLLPCFIIVIFHWLSLFTEWSLHWQLASKLSIQHSCWAF